MRTFAAEFEGMSMRLMTKLMENPDIVLYYKGKEGGTALDVAVTFSPDEAHQMDEESAAIPCRQLNSDKVLLHEHGYTEFEIIQ